MSANVVVSDFRIITILLTKIIRGATFLVIILLTLGCRSNIIPTVLNNETNDDQVKRMPEANNLIPSDSSSQIYAGLKRKKAVLKLYEARNFEPTWHHDQQVSTLGDSVIAFIADIRCYGLLPLNYHLNEIRFINDDVDSSRNFLRIDVLLTDAFLSIAHDLRFGRTRSVDTDSLDITLLRRVLKDNCLEKHLAWGQPAFTKYQLLKKGFRFLLDTLNEDDRKAVVEGRKTQNQDINTAIQLIDINIERWRKETHSFGERYIFINIPSFMLQVVSNSTSMLESKVIVGTPDKQTPILSSTIDCFTVYPYWHVPRKIAIDEYLPIIKNDISFITRNNFDVLDRKGNILNPDSVSWSDFNKNYFPVSLRQREGKENSLGVLKFIFDNPYAVYLHDTNAKRLFRNPIRAFSHGCVRMEKALSLAHYLITGDITKESNLVNRYLQREERRTINLIHPIPIYVRYFTCDFKDNYFQQYPDIYNKDQQLIEAFYQ